MHFIGLMSGTSFDGIDAVLVDFEPLGLAHVQAHHHVPYPIALRQALRQVNAHTPLAEVLALDAQLSNAYADAVLALLAKHGRTHDTIAAIGLHGQTVWHAPSAQPPVTCQLGDPSRLAALTGLRVVADFRQRDLADGGVGAPLAPLFHAALFADTRPRAVLNLGGIANLTVLDSNGKIECGFDCGPGNTLLDAWIDQHKNLPMDRDGQWAASGVADLYWVEHLLSDAYFQQPPPKSTGPEYFNLAWLADYPAHGEPVDVQAGLAQLTAQSVAAAIMQWGPSIETLIVTGGGAYNLDLLKRLARCLPHVEVQSSDALGIAPEQVEAIGFAWLARARWLEQPVDLTRVTGSRQPNLLGGVY